MLATHPEIAATVAESHLFDRGVGALFENHSRQARYEGFLSNYLSAEQLTGLIRDLCDGVLLAMRENVKPGAARVAEKTPATRYGARELIEQKLAVYPDATYVHVVRERGDVVRSLLRAPWADVDESEAGEWWRQAVDATRETIEGSETATYIELEYEELSAEPVAVVARLFETLGLQAGPDVEARLEAASRERISSFGPSPSVASSAGGGEAEAPAAVGGGRGQGGPGQPPRSLRSRVAGLARRVEARRSRNATSAQALLVAARRGDQDEVARLTHPHFALELRSGAGDLSAAGDPGRETLLEIARELFRAQAVSEKWSAIAKGETTVLMLSATYGDGTRSDLVATAMARNGVIERLALVAAGEPRGREPRVWSPPGAPARADREGA